MTRAEIIKKTFHILANALVSIITVVVLLSCIVFARILYAPLNLDFMSKSVTSRAQDFLPGWQVSFDSADLGWDWRHVRPWLRVEGASLIDRRDRMTVTVPVVRVDFSFSGILSQAAVSSIEFEGADFYVSDLAGFSDETDDSALADLLKFEGFPKPKVFKPLAEAFSRFSLRLLANAPRMESLTFKKSDILVVLGGGLDDLKLGIPTVRLSNIKDEFAVTAQIDAYFAEQPIHALLNGTATPELGDIALHLAINNIDMAALHQGLNLPDGFGYASMPIGLGVAFDLSSDVGLRTAAFNVTLGEGRLFDSVAYPIEAPIKYGVISGFLDVTEEVLAIDEFRISTGNRLIRGSGALYWENNDNDAGIYLDIQTPEVTIAEVLKYWPSKVYPDGTPRGARVWVDQNMLEGYARNVRFIIDRKPDGSTPFLENSLYRLTFDIEETDTNYLGDMAPLEGVKAKAVLTRTAFDVFIEEGTISGLPISGSRASMTNIQVPYEGIGQFDIGVKGPIQSILTIIDTPPVSITKRMNIDISRLSGDAEVEARITVPLIKKPAAEDVIYEVSAKVGQAAVRELLGGEGLKDAEFTLNLDRDSLTAEGKGLVNGVGLDLYWRENFAAGRDNPLADTSFLVLSGSVDKHDLAALGVDIGKYLDGKSFGEASFLGRNLKFRVGYFTADASAAVLTVPELGWSKKPDVPANITGTLNLLEKGAKLSPLVVLGEDIDVSAEIQFGSRDSGEFSLVANVRQLGKTSMDVSVTSDGTSPVEASIAARSFDAALLLASNRNTSTTIPVASENEASDFNLKFSAEKLLLVNGVALLDANMDLAFKEGEPKQMLFTATDQHGQVQVSVKPTDGSMQTLSVTTKDGGALLRGLALFPHFEEGTLSLTGTTKGWNDSLSIAGRMQMSDSFLVAKKALRNEVDTGVISGLDDYLEDNTMVMDIVDMPFTYEGGLLDIANLKANGPSMGMTMEGQIDATVGKINVNGVVVPAYGINSILGKIPLLGDIFSGGKGKGLFGVTYRVKGLIAEPKVSVNPLSGLAPGFLRNLFEGRKGKISTVKDAEQEAPAPEAIVPDSEEIPEEAAPLQVSP